MARSDKSDRSGKRQAKRAGILPEQQFSDYTVPARPLRAAPFEPKTDKQRKYAAAIRLPGSVVFGMGPAGTGKTYVAATLAADALMEKKVDKIILTRPAVEAGGENLGFLPGDKEEKFDAYFDPVRDVFEERLGKSFVDYLIKEGRIKCEPFVYMRGKTFKRAFVMLDEAQNATPEQFKLFLTRIGEDATVVVNGDESQVDIKGQSGFVDAANRIMHISSVKVVLFEKKDIVRSGFVREIVEAYEQPAPSRINPVLLR